MNSEKTITVGRASKCDIVLESISVSRQHAQVELTDHGYLAVSDLNSSNGTFLKRNGHWVRVRNARLGRQDSIRFGQEEVELDRLAAEFGESVVVQLRKNATGHLSDRIVAGMAEEKQVLENPRRNPVTGNIEENH